MEIKKIISGLDDLIGDRESFAKHEKDDPDNIFEYDKKVLNAAIETIKAQQQEIKLLNMEVAMDSCQDMDISRHTEICKAEAEGRLVVLPCKAGGTVYAVQGGEIIQCEVTEITICKSGISFIRLFSTDDRLADFRYEHFQKTVFLTREEAEKALQMRESEVKEHA